MGWVRKKTITVPHQCDKPTKVVYTPATSNLTQIGWTVPDGGVSDLWRCDSCNKLWKITVAPALIKDNRLNLHWEPASFWDCFLYAKFWNRTAQVLQS